MSRKFIYSETPVKEVKTLIDQLGFGPEEKDEDGCLVRKLGCVAVAVRETHPQLDAGYPENFQSRLYFLDSLSRGELRTHSCPLGKELYNNLLAALQNPAVYFMPGEEIAVPDEVDLRF